MKKKLQKAQSHLGTLKSRACSVLSDQRGDNHSTSNLGWIIIVCLIVAALGAGLLLIFNNDIIPSIQTAIDNLFNL